MKQISLLLVVPFAVSGCSAPTPTSGEKRLGERVEKLSRDVETLQATHAELQSRVRDLELRARIRSGAPSTGEATASEDREAIA